MRMLMKFIYLQNLLIMKPKFIYIIYDYRLKKIRRRKIEIEIEINIEKVQKITKQIHQIYLNPV